MKFFRNNTLMQQLLLVDGVGRSGKVMLAEMLTCLDRVEKQNYHEVLEYIPLAYHYGKIEKDIAKAILLTQMDSELYCHMIGRKINTRASDYTSVYKYHTPEKYLKRMVADDGPIVAERVQKERPIYLCWCHDLIQKSALVFETFADKLALIYINRRPIDVLYEWNVKDFGNRVGMDPTEMQYLIDYNGEAVPELAYGWEAEYLSLNPFERVLKLVHTSYQRNLAALGDLPPGARVLVLNFEDIVVNPKPWVDKMAQFLDTTILDTLDTILARERCPRELDETLYKEREQGIRTNITAKTQHYLDELSVLHKSIADLVCPH